MGFIPDLEQRATVARQGVRNGHCHQSAQPEDRDVFPDVSAAVRLGGRPGGKQKALVSRSLFHRCGNPDLQPTHRRCGPLYACDPTLAAHHARHRLPLRIIDGCIRPAPAVRADELAHASGRRPMSVPGRFCCRSPLMAFANGDSVALTRFAAEASDDGAAEARAGAAFLRVSARRGDTRRSPCARDAAVLDLTWVRAELASYYSPLGRPSIDPVLMIRMLIVGYVFAIRSERLLCRWVQVNLAYRWFFVLSSEDQIPDHSVF